MKELRFDAAGGVWRVAFAFDPRRKQSCSRPVRNQAEARSGFTGSASLKPIGDSTLT